MAAPIIQAKRNQKLESFRIDSIEVPPGRRELNEEAVARLVESIKKIGLRTPISVRIVDNYVTANGEMCDGQPLLVTGRHRLEAARRLAFDKIECWVLSDETETQARMWEISENLHRAELSALEHDQYLAEWIRLTEESDKDAEPRKRGPKNKPSQPVTVSTKGGRGKKSGIHQASRELGVNHMDARRALKVASLTDEAKEAARDVGLDDNRSALLKAAGQAPEHQADAIREIAAAKAEARREKYVEPPQVEECDLPEMQHRYEDITACWRWNEASKQMQELARSFHHKSRHERHLAVQLLVDLLDIDRDRYEWLHARPVPDTDGLLKRIEDLENENEKLRERIAIVGEGSQ